jgi:hypothetical protein
VASGSKAEKTEGGPAADSHSVVKAGPEKAERRDIKGGIPYVISPGTLTKALDAIIVAERPDKFSANYMNTILHLSGGSARAVPPFLKKMQFIGADASPTSLYSKFKTDGGRSQAAYDGLRNAFGELFRRNEFIHKADENAVKDVIVEITGLKKTDPIIRLMYSSFDAVRSYVISDVSRSTDVATNDIDEDPSVGVVDHVRATAPKLGLSYQINIVLPETDNISVFNAIFKSLRDNLLR